MANKSIPSQLIERIICALSYLTFGIAGVVWIIICAVMKNPLSSFSAYNIYQSIFFSIFIYILSLICSIAVGLLGVVPIIGKLTNTFVIFFTQTPIYFGYTLSGLIIFVLVCYLALFALIGRYPYIPFISEIIGSNFRR